MSDDFAKRDLDFRDSDALEAWLRTQPHEVSVIIAARAALRVLPLVATELPTKDAGRFAALISAVFRATALARVAAEYPTRANELRAAAAATDTARSVTVYVDAAGRASLVATSAAHTAVHAAYAARDDRVSSYASHASHAVARAAYTVTGRSFAAIWTAVSEDAAFFEWRGGVAELADRRLWPGRTPSWAAELWAKLKAALPSGDDWDVWTRWYEDRLKGALSRGEGYELIFATVPIEVWDEGPEAANRWIKEHLPPEPKTSEASSENGQETELLKQKAAPFAFRVVNGKIDVAPEDAVSIDEQVARDFHAEAKRKAAELKERLARAQADRRLQESLARLEQFLGQNVEDIRPGLILSALRSLESDHRAYDTEEGRKEHAPDLLAMLDDLAGSVRDLAAAYPKTREIIANQFALDLEERPASLEKLEATSDKLAAAAEKHPEVVAPAAAKALREPGKAISQSRTLKDRAGQLALRLLSDANFLRAIASLRDVVQDSLQEIGKQVPKAVGGATKTVVFGGIVLSGALGFGALVGHDGLALIKEVAGVVKELRGALDKPGSEFDKLSKKIEKLEEVAAKHEASKADPSPSSEASTKPTTKEPPPTKTPAPRKPTKKKPAKK
jgi:hypothetical protein